MYWCSQAFNFTRINISYVVKISVENLTLPTEIKLIAKRNQLCTKYLRECTKAHLLAKGRGGTFLNPQQASMSYLSDTMKNHLTAQVNYGSTTPKHLGPTTPKLDHTPSNGVSL